MSQETEIPTAAQPELETMRLEIDGDVGTLTLDRPDDLNAMSPQMIAEFAIIAPWLADRAPLRALVVTGVLAVRDLPVDSLFERQRLSSLRQSAEDPSSEVSSRPP